MVFQPDGRLLIAAGYQESGISRLNRDGSLDATFQTEVAWVRQMILQRDGRVLIAGGFHSVNGVPIHGIARLNNQLRTHARVAPQIRRGHFNVTLTGQPGVRLVLEASTDLVTWTSLDEVVLGEEPVTFVDPDAAQFPRRFYRGREAR